MLCVQQEMALGSLLTCLLQARALQCSGARFAEAVPVCPQELAEQEAAGRLPEQNSRRLLRSRVADPGENPQRLNRGREILAPGKPAESLRYCCST